MASGAAWHPSCALSQQLGIVSRMSTLRGKLPDVCAPSA